MIEFLKEWGGLILLTILLVIVCMAISWAATCGIVYLICMLIDKTFTWKIGTVVWLIGILISGVVKSNT